MILKKFVDVVDKIVHSWNPMFFAALYHHPYSALVYASEQRSESRGVKSLTYLFLVGYEDDINPVGLKQDLINELKKDKIKNRVPPHLR